MRRVALLSTVMPMLVLSACGGSGGGTVASTPTPPAAPATPPTPPPPPPPPAVNYNTAEYQRSNAAVQAQAIAAYNAGATGQGIVAAVIDSGVNANSAEFAGRISASSADVTGGARGIQDVDGHGTAVASVLLGAKNDINMHGVAFNATLLAARADTQGSCTATGGTANDGCSFNDNAIASGVNAAVQAQARVINISLGGTPANSNLRTAIGRATAAGIVVVISAGNDFATDPVAGANPDPLAQIALDPIARGLVLIAGATDANQSLAAFSNRAGTGQNFYLTALGVGVLAPDHTGTLFRWDGTSLSAPVVAGAVALLAQAFPTLTGAQIVDLLLRTATDLGATGTDAVYGRGELNLAKAFAPQGSTSLGQTAVPVSLTSNGMLSTPMGDAGVKTGMAVPIRDAFGRDYTVDLSSTLARAPQQLTLAASLMNRSRNLHSITDRTTLAVSVAEPMPRNLLLSREELRNARALAGSVATRLGPRTQIALGFASGSDALDRGLGSDGAPAFLVADSAKGFDKAPGGAFAARQILGGIAVTVAAESGDLRLWDRQNLGPRSERYHYYRYGAVTLGFDGEAGPVKLTGRLTRMNEAETVLGARLDAALGGSGATSWFGDARVTLPLRHWQLGASLRRGWTLVSAGFARDHSTIATQALGFDLTRVALFSASDSVSLRWAEPLRVVGGGIRLQDIGTLTLAPEGHERDVESVYASPVGRGWLTVNGYWRQQPNNFATAPDDLGAAVRYSYGF